MSTPLHRPQPPPAGSKRRPYPLLQGSRAGSKSTPDGTATSIVSEPSPSGWHSLQVTPPASPAQGRPRPSCSRHAKAPCEPARPVSPNPSVKSPDKSASYRRPRRQHTASSASAVTSVGSISSLVVDSTCSSAPNEASYGSIETSNARCISWTRGSKIGSGSYGCVYKALNTQTGKIFAVKEAVLNDAGGKNHSGHAALVDELKICKELRHPHIVTYLGHDYQDNSLCIYLEYVPGGSLASMLSDFGPLAGRPLKMGMQGLLEGLDFLHTRSPPVVHRDLKAANVLVGLDFCVKIADFGCSRNEVMTQSFTLLGSIPWMAPEVIQQKDGHGRKADIWSLGCTFIEMATAEKPWGQRRFDNVMEAFKHIGLSDATPPLPAALCSEARELISSCVQRSPQERPWAADLLQHPFLT